MLPLRKVDNFPFGGRGDKEAGEGSGMEAGPRFGVDRGPSSHSPVALTCFFWPSGLSFHVPQTPRVGDKSGRPR